MKLKNVAVAVVALALAAGMTACGGSLCGRTVFFVSAQIQMIHICARDLCSKCGKRSVQVPLLWKNIIM